jgi:hypothetical protein
MRTRRRNREIMPEAMRPIAAVETAELTRYGSIIYGAPAQSVLSDGVTFVLQVRLRTGPHMRLESPLSSVHRPMSSLIASQTLQPRFGGETAEPRHVCTRERHPRTAAECQRRILMKRRPKSPMWMRCGESWRSGWALAVLRTEHHEIFVS